MSTMTDIPQAFDRFFEPKPARDWLLTLCGVFVLFVALSAYAVNLFFSVSAAPQPMTAAATSTPSLSVTRADVENVLSEYRTRQANYAAH